METYNNRRPSLTTLLVLLFYLLISITISTLWWRGGLPFLAIGSDAGNIASFVAAFSDPDAFTGDIAIGDIDNFRFYATLHIPLLYVLQMVLGDFGTAYLVMLPITHFVQALGFFVLGRVLFKNDFVAFLLGCLAFAKVDLTIDYWGTYEDVQPRFLFSACLPWVLAASIRSGLETKAWAWILAMYGLLFYVHPVSGPSVAFASLLALVLVYGERVPMGERVCKGGLAGIVFLVVCTPFMINYILSREYGASHNFHELLALQKLVIGPYFFDAWLYLKLVLTHWKAAWLLPIWGVSGFAVLWYFESSSRRILAFLLVWIVGLLFASLGLTLVEQDISRRFNVMPMEIDLIRNVRYIAPILMITGLWGTYILARQVFSQQRNVVLFTSIVAAAWLLLNKPGAVPTRATVACLKSGKLLCPPEEWKHRTQVLEFLRTEIPRNTRVFPAVDRSVGIDVSLAVRYHALKPVVFTYKDGGTTLAYGNNAALDSWLKVSLKLDNLYKQRDISGMIKLGEELGASIILSDFGSVRGPLPPMWKERLIVGPYVIYEKLSEG